MKLRLQFGGGLLALGLSAAMALPSAAQSHNNRPPQQQRQPHAPRQTNRPPQQPGGRPQNKPPKNDGRLVLRSPAWLLWRSVRLPRRVRLSLLLGWPVVVALRRRRQRHRRAEPQG